MKINTHKNTLQIFDEDEQLIDTKISYSYLLYPAEGKLLRNKLNGLTTDSYFGISKKDDIVNYEEIDKGKF